MTPTTQRESAGLPAPGQQVPPLGRRAPVPAPATAAPGWLQAGLLLCAGALLSACGSSPPPAPYLHLAADEPGSAPPPRPTWPGPDTGSAAPQAWRLVQPVAVPTALDRDAVMVATAPGQWVHWQGLRWSEPLRDALPRVLAAELGAARGAPVWWARAWPGLPDGRADAPAPRPLRVAVLGWEASLPQAAVRLQAQWQLGPDEGVRVLQGQVNVQVPWPEATPAGLVRAQRQALSALAQALVADTVRAQAGADAGRAPSAGLR